MDDVICLSSDEENEKTPKKKNDDIGIQTGDVADVEILNLDNDDEKDVVDLTLNNSPECSTSKTRPTMSPPFSSLWDALSSPSKEDPWDAIQDQGDSPGILNRSQSQILSTNYDKEDAQPKKKKRKSVSQQNIPRKNLDQDEKNRLKEERENAKRAKLEEQTKKRIIRQISASIKSKSQQHMFCHVSKKIFQEFSNSEDAIKLQFQTKKIEEQLRVEDTWTEQIVEFRRNTIGMIQTSDGSVAKTEKMVTQHVTVRVLHAVDVSLWIQAGCFEDSIQADKRKLGPNYSQIFYIIYGRLNVPDTKLSDISLEIYSKYNTHIYQVENSQKLASALTRIHNALSKLTSMQISESENNIRYISVKRKGSENLSGSEMVADIWDAMLAQLPRMSNAYRRALVKKYPNPMEAADKFSKMGKEAAIKEISEVMAENRKRVGPVLARRIYLSLTEEDGDTKLYDR